MFRIFFETQCAFTEDVLTRWVLRGENASRCVCRRRGATFLWFRSTL